MWRSSMAGLPRGFWYLWLGALVNRLGSFVVPFLALYLTGQRHFSVERAGLTVSLYGLGSFAAGPVGGVLADRLGRRTSLGLASCLGAAAMLHMGLARAPAHIYVAALVLGFAGDLYRPAMQAMVADLVPPADRPRAFGLLYWAINLGWSSATLLAGLLVGYGYVLLFAGDALTTLALGAIVWLRVGETRAADRAREVRQFAAPYRDGVFMSFVGLAFVTAVVFLQHGTALPLDMRAHGLSPRQFGALIAINGAMIVVVQPLAAPLVGRLPRSRALAAGALTMGLGFGLTALAATPAGYALSIAVWTAGEIATLPLAPSVVADLAPPSLRGSYQGAHQMAWGAAWFVAPALGSFVLGRLGATALWCGCLAAGAGCALGHLAIAGARRRRLLER
jgi:MFS family permease